MRVREARLEVPERLFLREQLLPLEADFALRTELEVAQLLLCNVTVSDARVSR